jgi:hypothetical protein
MRRRTVGSLLLSIVLCGGVLAQVEDLNCVWPARWIVATDAPTREYNVQHFRRSFTLDTLPDSLIVHTSGDNRYQLLVNGKIVTWGPQRGDLRHWHYESTDLTPHLRPGANVIAAVVLNYGSHPPDAQLSVQSGFLLAANRREFRHLNTGTGDWLGLHNQAYSAHPVSREQTGGYYGAGSKERVDGRQYPRGWQRIEYDDSAWAPATVVESAFARGCRWASRWKLTPHTLPLERWTAARFQSVRRAEGVDVPAGFVAGRSALVVPARTTASFVLDYGDYFTAYPEWSFTGGRDAILTFTYVEAPHYGELRDRNKGHRGVVEGKQFVGVQDVYAADGSAEQSYRPLWWRAGRYIRVDVATGAEPLTVDSVALNDSHFPFTNRASWAAVGPDTALLTDILRIGDRTLRANAHEHYTDCPYYEESQFEGDTRIQALASYYQYGEARLARNAIEQFSWSLTEEGFLSARYPTNSLYYIPNYSLYWIGMLYDYAWLVDDPDFVGAKLPVARMILGYFLRHQREDGTLLPLDYHEFIDWAFPKGEAPRDRTGYGALPDLSFLQALEWAIALEEAFGEDYYRETYRRAADQLRRSIHRHYWHEGVGLFTDVPGDTSRISEHTNSLAILTGVVSGQGAGRLFDTLQTVERRTRATLYWRFYYNEAMAAAGRGDHYLNSLHPWETMVELGASTWPETGPNSRSECHGWGASPNYHLYSIVAGITSGAPGWREVRIEPRLGELSELRVQVPHPAGQIAVDLKREAGRLSGSITLPPGTSGEFIWKGGRQRLRAGTQVLRLPDN